MDTRRMRIDGAWIAPWLLGNSFVEPYQIADGCRRKDFVTVHLGAGQGNNLNACRAEISNHRLPAIGSRRQDYTWLADTSSGRATAGFQVQMFAPVGPRTQDIDPTHILEIDDHLMARCRGCGCRHIVIKAVSLCPICVSQHRATGANLPETQVATIRQGCCRRVARATMPRWPAAMLAR